jgi:hypothetical protein
MLTRTALPTLLASLALATVASADLRDRLYDFTDAHYLANGINPAKLAGRKQAPSASAVFDTPFFSWQRNVRVTGTSSGYGHNGDLYFFSTFAGYGPDAFTNDAAGRKAKELSEKYIEYMFPVKGTNPVGFALRQSVVLDTNHGYFSKNPLGLWLHVWITYTDKAFNTKDGRKELADLQRRNGLASDGTPMIRKTGEIEKLYKEGYIAKHYRTDSVRYAVCPMYKDPRGGAIAPDATLSFIKMADGVTPLEPHFVNLFKSLQSTGNNGPP